MSSFSELELKVIQWAEARKIIPNSTPQAQLLKAFEEMGELAGGLAKGKDDVVKDSIGDVLVCLINFCALKDISMASCLEGAWQEIRHRKGTLMPNGIFVKEE